MSMVEPNGTLRMVVSNHDRLPGVIVKGKESSPSDRPRAGMLTYNNEGSENGGYLVGIAMKRVRSSNLAQAYRSTSTGPVRLSNSLVWNITMIVSRGLMSANTTEATATGACG